MPFNVPSHNYPLNYSMKCPIKQITIISILFPAFCGLFKSAGYIKEALSHEGMLSNRSYLQNGFMSLSCVFHPHFLCQFANYQRHWWLGSTASLAAHLCRGEVTALSL